MQNQNHTYFSLLRNNVGNLQHNILHLTIVKFIYLTNPPFSVIGITETKIINPTVRKFNTSLANYQFENLNVHQPTNSSILWKRVIYVKNSLNYTVLEKNPERLSRLYGLKLNFYMTTHYLWCNLSAT